MITNNYYLFQVTMVWGLLYLFYYLFLGKETFFKTNRIYLLGVLVAGLVLPFVQAALQDAEVGLQVVRLPVITITNQETPLLESAAQAPSFDLKYWLLVVYWIGVGVMSLRLLRDFIGLVWMIRGHRKERIDGLTLVYINRDMAPFSFFNYLFVFDRDRFLEEEWGQILLHEKTHIDQLHSLDILFTEVLKIIFWWNPLTYLYQRSLREVHEYEADHAVKKQENMKQYGLLLMKQSLSGNQVAVANSFINSQLKKRIIMMTKKRSNSLAKYKYAWTLPLLLMFIFVSFGNRVLAQKVAPKIASESLDTIFTVDPETYEETMRIVKSVYYENNMLDKIAILAGCESAGNLDAQRKCSTEKLLNDFNKEVKYPAKALTAGMEGEVLVMIIVDRNGDATYVTPKDTEFSLGAEVIRAMHAANFIWRPAELGGKKVNVEFILPVKFVLEGDAHQPVAEEEESPFSDIKINYTGDRFRIDFRHSNGDDESVHMTIYDLSGRFIGSDAGTTDYFENNHFNCLSPVIIVVLEDENGNKAVRKVARTD